MALRDLVDGDCAGPSSLIRLTSHLIQDHGFQEDGLTHQHVFPPSREASMADQFVEQFVEETNSASPQTFKMDNILREMQKMEYNPRPFIPSQEKFGEFTGYDTAWASQYLASGRHFDENRTDAIWNSELDAEPNNETLDMLKHQKNSNELGLGPLWADEYLEHSVSLDNKLDIREITDSVEKHGQIGAEENFNPPHLEHSKLMKYMHKDSDVSTSENVEKSSMSDPYEKWLEKGTNSDSLLRSRNNNLSTAEVWAKELEAENGITIDSDKYDSVFWASMLGEWNKISAQNNLIDSHPWLPEYEEYYDPFNEYKFQTENPLRNVSNALEEGKRRLEAGDLPSAVLCFEAAVQEQPENADAWLILGKTQAENEQDPMAISALKNCLHIEPTNADALMTLAISYTNESYQNQACLTLKEWLSKHEKYKHVVESPVEPPQQTRSKVSTILFNDVHNEVKQLYITAARLNPHDSIDSDVQNGLGVLFNLSCEYEKAADCFQAALSVRPDDSRLWNRYGATLANGQRSEEAIVAYRRALELSPGFIRARYNLGISCINLLAYKEAAEHLLTALNQQAAGRGVQGDKNHPGVMSDAIWSTLRLVLSLMHKYNLNEAVEKRDLTTLNREFEIE